MYERETASQRCPQCRRSFTVLADEYGDHDCPYCGFSAREPDEDDDDNCGCDWCKPDDDEEEDGE